MQWQVGNQRLVLLGSSDVQAGVEVVEEPGHWVLAVQPDVVDGDDPAGGLEQLLQAGEQLARFVVAEMVQQCRNDDEIEAACFAGKSVSRVGGDEAAARPVELARVLDTPDIEVDASVVGLG